MLVANPTEESADVWVLQVTKPIPNLQTLRVHSGAEELEMEIHKGEVAWKFQQLVALV